MIFINFNKFSRMIRIIYIKIFFVTSKILFLSENLCSRRSVDACCTSDSIGTGVLKRNIDKSKFLQLVVCQWVWSSRETLHALYFAPKRERLFFSFFLFSAYISSCLFISLTKLLFEIEEFLMNFRLRIVSSTVLVLLVVVVSRL